LEFFDNVANKVSDEYKKLTCKESSSMFSASGFANLSLLDREQPFGDTLDTFEDKQSMIKNIIYEFKPPNK
jgi:hypothetical protein